jgi:hypothetical protein
VVGVQQWAEIRRMVLVEGRSQREVARVMGLARDTVARMVRSKVPPRYVRAPAGSKLDPFKPWICEQLAADARMPSQRLRELAGEPGYAGSKTIFDDYVREVRPRFLVRRTFERTIYRPGELVQCDLWEPRLLIPVGYGQTRRGWVVTCQLCWSRVIAGALVFSKESTDILWGLGRRLWRIGALPEKLVWDREAAIAAGGRPTDAFASFCGQLGVSWLILGAGARRPRARWSARTGSCALTSCLAGGSPTSWTFRRSWTPGATRANARTHRTTRAVPAERLAEERDRMSPLPAVMPDLDRRFVIRVPQQPYLRWDRNDYSLGPAAGRPPGGGVRLPARDHGGRAGHRRSGLPASALVRGRARVHRPHPSARVGAATRGKAPPGRRRDPLAGQIRRPDPGMTGKTSELAHLFRALKAPAAAQAFPKLAERAREESWSYERFCEALLSTEVSARESHGGEGRIKQARFPARKTLEEFDFTFQRSVKRQVVELDFLHAKENVVLLGPQVPAKPILPSLIGIRACLAGQRVAFATATGRAPRRAQSVTAPSKPSSNGSAISRSWSSTRSATSLSTRKPQTSCSRSSAPATSAPR